VPSERANAKSFSIEQTFGSKLLDQMIRTKQPESDNEPHQIQAEHGQLNESTQTTFPSNASGEHDPRFPQISALPPDPVLFLIRLSSFLGSVADL
jgi:hypothetical protein